MVLSVRSSAELRDALHSASPGETIELAPGEYRGPLIIDKPLVLRGLDRQTVLWRHGGPVIYCRSLGIRLERLLIERTVDAQGPLVIHQTECMPTGKESMEVNGELLISLGDLLPGHTLTLPLELETSARTEITVAGLHGAAITPTVLESAGKHQVRLTLDGNTIQKGEILLGEIALREGEHTRYVWVSGVVGETTLPEGQFCLATPKMKIYPSASGLILDGTQLSNLEGGKGLKGRFAVVQRESGGALSMFIPGEPPAPIFRNGVPLARGTRIVLRLDDVLKIGSVELKVENAEPLPFSIEPGDLKFADFVSSFPESVALTLNTGRANWRGQLLATVPWLTVSPAGNLRLSGSRAHTWSVALNEQALLMPDGVYEITGGLVVISAAHLVNLDVQVMIRRLPVFLRVRPVEFGPLEWGWPSEQTVDIYVENLGRDAWSGTVKPMVSWLEIITPLPVYGETWSETLVQAQFIAAAAWDKLTVGVNEIPDALIVTGPDGDHPVPIKIEVSPAQGHLTLSTSLISFDNVERGAFPLPEATLQVRNDGSGTYTGSIHVGASRVQVQPGELTLAPGTSADITVELLDVPADQPSEIPVLIDELQFDNGSVVGIQLTIVELPPFLVVRPVNFPPFVKGDTPPDGLLSVHNLGPAIWRGTVKSNVPWLTVPDRTFACDPGEIVDIYLTLASRALDQFSIGLNRTDNALSITGGRELVSTSVQIDLRDAALEMCLDTPTLNFGQVNGALTTLPADTVRLLNASPNPWKGKVEVKVPWLTLEGGSRDFDLEIPRLSVAEFRVMLNDAARWLPPGPLDDDQAITITGNDPQNRQKMSVRVLIWLNEWTPRLEIKPSKLTLTDHNAQSLTVRNVGGRAWALQVSAAPWLNVVPASFSLETGGEQRLEVSRNPDSAVGIADDPRAVVIIGHGHEIEVRVEVKMIDKPTERSS